jgi:hypothetical protein
MEDIKAEFSNYTEEEYEMKLESIFKEVDILMIQNKDYSKAVIFLIHLIII